MSLLNLIQNFKKKKRILFTTPSHNQGKFVIPDSLKMLGKKIFESDYSEIEGFDNLSNPMGAILKSELKASNIYGSKHSFYLINGTTSGILASMIAILSPTDKVLISRNCHKSIYSGLVLSKAYPLWFIPEQDHDWDIFKSIDCNKLEKTLSENPDIKAFILTNPTYEGAISDITAISKICQKYNVILIVDEAHGALWNFDKELGTPSISLGADISVQSLHKTAGALNSGAIMHISKSSIIKPEKIKEALNLITTTSPSYPALLNIENTINFLYSKQGKKEIAKLKKNILKFKNNLKKHKNIQIYENNNDTTKILIKINGLTGQKLSEILFEKYNIEDELANTKAALFLTGIGTTSQKLKKLEKALKKIGNKTYKNTVEDEQIQYPDPKTAITPAEAFDRKYKTIPLQEAVGRIVNELVIPYPPGIPVIMPGEILQTEHLKLLNIKTIKVIDNAS